VGFLPELNLNTSLSKKYSINLKLESRQRLADNFLREEVNYTYDYVLTDISLMTARRLGVGKKITTGYQLRKRDGNSIHRSILQYSFVNKSTLGLMAHRLTTDQTFSNRFATEYRLRYRISLEVPLSGSKVNPGEFYLKLQTEGLNSWQKSNYDLELRFAPYLAYLFSDANKLELGGDYRLNSFINGKPSDVLWLNLSWFIKIQSF